MEGGLKKLILLIATGGGAGYLPRYPGFFGSLVGLLLYWPMSYLPLQIYLITLFALIFLASWVSTIAEVLLGQKDAQKIVIDEVVGILVTLALVPYSLQSAATGFVLFRIFDVWKPFPVRLCQDRLPGGWGVVGDDVMAGIYANLVLQLLLWKLLQ